LIFYKDACIIDNSTLQVYYKNNTWK